MSSLSRKILGVASGAVLTVARVAVALTFSILALAMKLPGAPTIRAAAIEFRTEQRG